MIRKGEIFMIVWAMINHIIQTVFEFFRQRKWACIFVIFLIYCCIVGAAGIRTSKIPLEDKYKIQSYEIYQVKSGDTIWDISCKYAPNNISIDRFNRLIMDLSDKENADIFPGEILKIPIIRGADSE